MSISKKNIEKKIVNLEGRVLDTGKMPIRTYSSIGIQYEKRLLGNTINKKSKSTKKSRTLYLKINRDCDYSYRCIQQWLDVALEINADYYFVCDNKMLEYKVRKNCVFPDSDIKFIKSIGKEVDDIVNNICTSFWVNATHAHLTPFFHAKKHGIQKYWTIDADDTYFLMETNKIAKALLMAENVAEENNISALTYDMHVTRTRGKHWSLGIVFINDTVDFCDCFKSVKDKQWAKNILGHYDNNINLDWFMTYLKTEKNYNFSSFYVDNSYFIHWGNNLIAPMSAGIYHWNNNKLYLPILIDIFKNKKLGELDISKEIYRIDVGVSEEEGIYHFRNVLCNKTYQDSLWFKVANCGGKYWN